MIAFEANKKYFESMNAKVKTTITIEADLHEQVKNAAKNFHNRSEIYEQALHEYLPKLVRKTQEQKLTREKEIELMNRYADDHREELLETLCYQIDW